jgi:2-methylisocitrate lyase-like PEP mutase family enzyme
MSAQPTEETSTSAGPAKAARFLSLHRGERPLLLANAWDPGSARLLASLGFQALATTSSGYAATLGRLDYAITREESLAHAAALVDACELPVSADFENGFADDPAGVAESVRLAAGVGLAGARSRTGPLRSGGSTRSSTRSSGSRPPPRPPTATGDGLC